MCLVWRVHCEVRAAFGSRGHACEGLVLLVLVTDEGERPGGRVLDAMARQRACRVTSPCE